MRVSATMAFVAGMAVVRPTAASPSARLVYARSREAAACPDENALRKAVAARFGYDPFFPWAKQAVIVQVWREINRYSARVQVIDEEGLSRGTRELTSEDSDCSELFDATALTISIALDASLAPSPNPPALPPPQPEPAAPTVEIEPAPPWPAPVDLPPPSSRQANQRFDVGTDVLVTTGLAPGPAPGFGGFVSVRWASVRSVTLSVEMGLHGDLSLPVAVSGVGSVESTRLALSIAPCAHLRFAFACPIVEAGLVQASSLGLVHNGSGGAPFVVAGGRLGAEVPVSRTFYVRIFVDGLADLDRPRFELDGQPNPWTAPPIAAEAGVGLAVIFQ